MDIVVEGSTSNACLPATYATLVSGLDWIRTAAQVAFVSTAGMRISAAVHEVESASFWNQLIENFDIVQLAIADVNEADNGNVRG